jgi:hypothetical protein
MILSYMYRESKIYFLTKHYFTNFRLKMILVNETQG